MLSTILHSSFIHGATAGLLAAAAVDFQAFRGWKSFSDAHNYAWGLALWRWLQGAVIGGLTTLGYGAIS